MLNPGLNFETLKEKYLEKRYIQIKDFLREDVAELVHEGLKDVGERNLWYSVRMGNPRYFDRKRVKGNYMPDNFNFSYERFPLKNITIDDLKKDSFRYEQDNLKKLRLNPEMELPVEHPLRKLGDLLDSKEMHDLISFITKNPLSYYSVTLFASRFMPCDYISLHSDSSYDGTSTRRVAFVLNMTKNWLVHWGGNLVVLDDSFENIIDDYMPRFNSLILFDVPLPHAVLPVSVYAQSERFAITGWYNNNGKYVSRHED